MKKFSLFTLLVAVIALLPLNRTTAQQPSVWDGDTISTKWYESNPTLKSLTISTAADLAGLAQLVNEGKSFLGCTVTLANDIDLDNHPWTPIGVFNIEVSNDNGFGFQGYFDGGGKTIRNLKMNRIEEEINVSYLGLFGIIIIPETAVTFGIANLTLQDGEVLGGGEECGLASLVGILENRNKKTYRIENCRNENVNIISNATEYNCMGGLVAFAQGAIDFHQCFNSGNLNSKSGRHVMIGGIIGDFYGINSTLSSCANTGNITETTEIETKVARGQSRLGGLVGSISEVTDKFTLKNGYNKGSIRSNQADVGGLVGCLIPDSEGTFLLTSSWSTGELFEGGYVGGLVGSIREYDISSTTITISNCISFPRSLRGETATTHRIYGRSIRPITLSNNYASYGRYEDGDEGVNEKGIEGKNWTGKNADQPLSSWNKETNKPWVLSPTQVFLPMLKDVDSDFHTRNVEAFRVQFDTRGGSKLEDVAVFGKHSIDRPIDPIRDGYILEAWYKDPELKEEWRFDVNVVTKDLTIYAKWKQTHYLVYFDTQGGSKIDSALYLVDQPIMTPPTPPTKAKYIFMGWYADAAGKTAWVFGKDGTKLTQETTLYAKWYKDGALVTFDSMGGTAVDPIDAWKGETIERPNDPTRKGYCFFGWFADEAFTKPWYFGETGTPVEKDITLYAKWLYNIGREEITVDAIPAQAYTGKALFPKVYVRQADTLLIVNEDYLLDYKNNIEIGTATVSIVGINGYADIRTVDFMIEMPKVYYTLSIPEVEGATTLPEAGSYEIEEGEEASLKIMLEEGFSFKYTEVFINNELVYPDLLKNYEVTVDDETISILLGAMTEDIIITISGVSPVSIGETSALFALIARDGALEINAQQAANLNIFRSNGAIVKQQTVGVGSTIIPLTPGTYFVQIDDNSWKVIVR